MKINRNTLRKQKLTYLNQDISLAELVAWAEQSFVDGELEPEADIDLLNDILAYLAASDTAQFPLTWEICANFLHRLGVQVRVIVE
jgi:hypothetical protein